MRDVRADGRFGDVELLRDLCVGEASREKVQHLSLSRRELLESWSRRGGFVGIWNIAAGAGDIWATTPRDGALWRIDPKTNAVTRMNFPYLPTGVTADANDVWVTVREK